MNVLFVTWDAGGNVPPFLGLGRELVHRGHQVRCLAPQSLQAAVTHLGMVFRPFRHGATCDPLAPLTQEESEQASLEVFFGEGLMTDLRMEVESERPDVAVIDCFLAAAQAAAEAMRLPFALLVHTLPGWFGPFWDQHLLAPTNATRERAGLVPVLSTTQLWTHAEAVLVASLSLLDSPPAEFRSLPRLRYVGPIFEPDDLDSFDVAIAHETGEPLVLVGFSTTFMNQHQLLTRVIEVLGDLPVRAIVTAGPAVDMATLAHSPNVSVHRWLPHAAVLPYAALVITHAGHSTVTKALSHGVPLLCLPLGRDQGYIAQRVQDIGAGCTLRANAAPGELTAASRLLLHDDTYRVAARQVAESIQVAGTGAKNAAAELESLSRVRLN